MLEVMRIRSILGRLAMCMAAIWLVGCSQPVGQTRFTSAPRPVTVSPWTFEGRAARTVSSDHYALHTTIDDPDFIESLVQVMEGAYTQYQALAPAVSASRRPMDCYIFSGRKQWAQFTKENTGDDAAVYLQINRGGYTVRDWFVAYYIGAEGTYAVAAHEGWHQYVARHFHSRLPPFLEEGIATMFENITFRGRSPRWDLSVNPNRVEKLRNAIEDNQLWPIDQLCTMHAGDVVALSGERIETFYAQDWAFAHFMMNGQGGRYRDGFHRMLNDLATGEADQWTGRRKGPPENWDPRTVRPLLEHYLGMNMKQIDEAYQAYIRQIAYGRSRMPS